jgi:hypothetical protein
VCALQEVQLYDVDRQHWHQALQAGAEIGSIAIPGPQLVLAAAGRDMLLWRGRLLMRKLRGVCFAAPILLWPPFCCHRSSLPAAPDSCCVVLTCPIHTFVP